MSSQRMWKEAAVAPPLEWSPSHSSGSTACQQLHTWSRQTPAQLKARDTVVLACLLLQQEILRPFLLVCESKNPRLIGIVLGSIQKLLAHNAVSDEGRTQIIQALQQVRVCVCVFGHVGCIVGCKQQHRVCVFRGSGRPLRCKRTDYPIPIPSVVTGRCSNCTSRSNRPT